MSSTNTAAKTCNKDRWIWLIGGTLESISGSKHSVGSSNTSPFFSFAQIEKKTIQFSATIKAREVNVLIGKSQNSSAKRCHIIEKIKIKIHG